MCSENTTKSDSCCLWFDGILCAILAILFIVEFSKYGNIMDYEEGICNITRATYPTEMPTESTLDLWTKCDCGRNCYARYPCVKLFTDMGTDFIREGWDDRRSECTFNKKRCSNGEDAVVIANFLNNSIESARAYINSGTTKCYFVPDSSEDPVFLDLDIETSKIKTCVFGSILATLILINCCCFCCSKRKNQSKGDSFAI